MKEEMEERIFYSNFVEYKLGFMEKRHSDPKIANLFGQKLLDYYQFVCSKAYPEKLFNRENGLRCSSFQITGLKLNAQKKISLELIGSGKVHLINSELQPSYISKSILNLPKLAETWYQVKSYLLKSNPGHKILDKILEMNENGLAIEVPIWTTTHKAVMTKKLEMSPYTCLCDELITGHVDLLIFDETDNSLIVCDYKPENQFLKSLPQIAVYGLVLKRMLKYSRVKCVSFSREKAWMYDPEILRTTIPDFLIRYGNPHLKWQEFINSI